MTKVLIIDDDIHICKAVEIMLKTSGFDVTVSHDGKDALGKLEEDTPDIIICDVMMPVMDGYQFTQALREKQQYSSIPVILLTAKSEDKDILKGYRNGADYYMTKPFTKQQLLYGVEIMMEDRG